MISALFALAPVAFAEPAWPEPWAWRRPTGVALVAEPADDGAPDLRDATWSADADHLFLRWVVAGSDAPSVGAWLDIDGDAIADLVVETPENGSPSLRTVDGTGPGPGVGAPSVAWDSAADHRRADVDGDVIVEIAVPRQILADVGVGPDTAFALAFVAGAAAWTDRFGCVGDCLDAPIDGDPVRLDADGDGLTDALEAALGADPADRDTDDDGLVDGLDPFVRVCDGDGDGVLDGVESGISEFDPGTNPASACARVDVDPSTTTDPRRPDSDGGGLADASEDRNANGAVDRWESDPADPSDDADRDGDRLADVVEGSSDPDNDGIPAFADLDSDGDGLWDILEGTASPDGGDTPAFLDTDSDGDGLPDAVEGYADPDNDGVWAVFDLDSDNDGLPDAVEGLTDPDADGKPSFLDDNSDGAGGLDAVEGDDDRDCDGVADYLDREDDDATCLPGQDTPAVDPSAWDVGFVDDDTEYRGGCDASGGGAAGWGLVGVLLARRSRRRA